ncbi:hypothetical protein [Spirosoma aerolatum]|uniref:hypothetical protein n=1 Tax=Spirosoma aerolatum TaxID=1211326 RepID=UPI0009AE1E0C|nr:hypothetical protein [Spirosoma aerolatum]
MKTIKHIATGLIMAGMLNACTPKMSFVTSTIVPAANGKIDVTKDENKNYLTHLRVSNLADPQKLTPARNLYLVWMESDNSVVRKLGQLMPSGKTLDAELTTTSVAKPNEIFITAEDKADITNPEGQIILTTKQ